MIEGDRKYIPLSKKSTNMFLGCCCGTMNFVPDRFGFLSTNPQAKARTNTYA
jgi:hypothetical protein